MAYTNLEAVRRLAKDLAKEKPRSAHDRLAGYELAARALDNWRATLADTTGDYEFNCPLDQRFFKSTGIDPEEFRAFVATGADDDAVDYWISEHATTPA